MRGAVSVLVMGSVMSLKWRCSPRISTQPTALHHCALSLITRVPLWGPLGRPLCWWPCYHHKIAWGMCQEALDMERSNGEERTESKWRKDKDYDLQYGTRPPAEFRRVSMRRLSHWSGQQQHLLQWLQALGAQEMQWVQALEKRPWIQMYTMPGNCTPLGWQTTEGSPGWTWQAWGGSFLLLLRRHALSSRWLWNFQPQHVWKPPGKSSRMCYQFSLHATSLSKHVAVCTAFVCRVQCSMPARLGHWQSQTASVSSETTGQWSDRSAMSDCKTLSPPGPMNYLCGLALRIWIIIWRREDADGMDMWNTPMVQSRQPLTYRLMESLGLGGPRWHWNSWQRGIAETEEALGHQPSRQTYLEIWCEICHACSKPVIWKGAHWCGCCPCTFMLIKNLIMIWWYDDSTWGLLSKGYWQFFQMVLHHWTRWLPCPYMVKTLKILLQDQESFEAESWYVALGTQGLLVLYKWWS